MSGQSCAMLVWDEVASKGGPVVWRPCGAPSRYVITMHGDSMFAVCHRHNARLERAGVALVDPRDSDRLAVPA